MDGSFAKIGAIALAIVYVGGLTILVTNQQTAAIIKAIGDAFVGGLRAAMGR